MKNNYSRFTHLFILFILIKIAYSGDKKDEMEDSRLNTFSTDLAITDSLSGNAQNEEISKLDMIKACRTVGLVSDLVVGFEKTFAPPAKTASSANQNKRSIQQAVEIISGTNIDPMLLQSIPKLITGKSSHSKLKTSEHNTMLESAVRVGMQQRPQYFSSVLSETEELPMDAHLGIGSQFLREFTQNGHLDGWLFYVKEDIKEKETDESKQDLITQFIDGIGSILKYVGSDDIHDPLKDPLNKYVTSEDLDYIIQAREWLRENPEHEAYDQVQYELQRAHEIIRGKRDQAIREGGEFVFSMLKQMDPTFSDIEKPEDILTFKKRQWVEEERADFTQYVLEELEKEDIFEPNVLRRFWEHVERNEYGEICYRMVCESFQDQYKDNGVHKVLKNIWLVSHLDTIHEQPQDARTRMPIASIDGLLAPNFGYRMERSTSYQAWLANPLVRACGDIIMDAFHTTVDIGRSLDIPLFMQRLEIDLWGSAQEQEARFVHRHPYDRFIIDFQFYLLEKVFNTSFVSDGKKSVSSELLKASKTKNNLIKKAFLHLKRFKNMARCMYILRPTGTPLTPKEERDGLVFGIGFNGELFNSPSHSAEDDNEIWLTFSKSRRDDGGYLFLEFLKDIARCPDSGFYDHIIHFHIDHYFELYKPLIKQHIKKLNKDTYFLSDLSRDSYSLQYINNERAKYEGFMSQIELDLPFKNLDPKFQSWIKHTSNWYKIPSLNSCVISLRKEDLKIAPEMPQEEYAVQYAARNILFDALIGRSFSQEYNHLMSLLFLHWKDDLLKEIPENVRYLVQTAQRFEDLSGELQYQIIGALDKIIKRIHPELRSIWQPVIAEKFQDFRIIKEPTDKKEKLEQDLKNIKEKIRSETKKLKQLEKAKNPVSEMLEQTQKSLDEMNQQKQQIEEEIQEIQIVINQLPNTPSGLNKEIYEEFRTHFFDGREVEECVEPLFARVLGHDRFFPVYISKKVNKTNIIDSDAAPLQLGNRIYNDVIAPCNKRCRHHALGHLYAGDMLCYQSADHRDTVRKTHNLDGVPDRIMTFKHFNN